MPAPSRKYVFLSRKIDKAYDNGSPVTLDWVEISENTADLQIKKCFPGEYALGPQDRVYILQRRP